MKLIEAVEFFDNKYTESQIKVGLSQLLGRELAKGEDIPEAMIEKIESILLSIERSVSSTKKQLPSANESQLARHVTSNAIAAIEVDNLEISPIALMSILDSVYDTTVSLVAQIADKQIEKVEQILDERDNRIAEIMGRRSGIDYGAIASAVLESKHEARPRKSRYSKDALDSLSKWFDDKGLPRPDGGILQ